MAFAALIVSGLYKGLDLVPHDGNGALVGVTYVQRRTGKRVLL